MSDDWITIRAAVDLSSYHPDHVRRLIKTGEVKGRKFATVWQVSRASLLVYLRKQDNQGERRGRKPAG
jgi:hypothetical protein